MVFSSAAPNNTPTNASFEGDGNDQTLTFTNVDAAKIVTNVAAATSGTKTIRLNQTYKIGPTKSVHVYAGDKIDLEVWEYHEAGSGFGTSGTALSTLITAVATSIGGVSGGAGEAGLKYNGVSSAFNGFGTGGNQGDARPAAYLNYILFDKTYKVLDAGWQLTPSTTFTKQKISFPTKTITEEGFMVAWLSYDDDSNNWVYFDDFKVTHSKSNIVQYNEYYPYGLQTANSWTRENTTGNNFLGNGGTELNATSNLYDLEYRNYDPVLGRMNGVDPMATKYASLTPYNFSFNDPVSLTDPSGAEPQGYGSRSPYHTFYTNDDRVDFYSRGEFYYGSSSAINFHRNGMDLRYGGGDKVGTLEIDMNALPDGVYIFGFTNGWLTDFAEYTVGSTSSRYGTSYYLYDSEGNGSFLASVGYQDVPTGNVIIHITDNPINENYYLGTRWKAVPVKNIDEMQKFIQDYSLTTKITKLIIVGHGGPEHIRFGVDGNDASNIITYEEADDINVPEVAKLKAIIDLVSNNGDVVMLNCLAGMSFDKKFKHLINGREEAPNIYLANDLTSTIWSSKNGDRILFDRPFIESHNNYSGFTNIRNWDLLIKNISVGADGTLSIKLMP